MEWTPFKLAVLNAVIIGLIVIFSRLIADPGLPTFEGAYQSIIAGVLAFLFQLKGVIDDKVPPDVRRKRKENKTFGAII